MSAVLYFNDIIIIDGRTCISVFDGDFRKRCQNINVRNGAGRRFYAVYALLDSAHEFGKQLIFEIDEIIVGGEKFFFDFFQLGRYKALSADKRLFSYVCVGDKIFASVRDFDIVSENLIVTDFQSLDTRFFFFRCLKICHDEY